MEIVFYVGMICFGLYCLVSEDIDKVKKDFGVKYGVVFNIFYKDEFGDIWDLFFYGWN